MSGNRPRVRELNIIPGLLPPGPLNSITDVAGVRVGHVTLIEGDGPLVPGKGPVRTGVTAILPHDGDILAESVTGVVYTLNGVGEVTGAAEANELGSISGPIMLTNTMNVPRVADAVYDWALAHDSRMGVCHDELEPLVAECSDWYLNDIRGRHVRAEHVLAAIENASGGLPAEGAVGAGTGMSALGFKGGIGTASRILRDGAETFTVGCLALCNFGIREQLRINGVPVGQALLDWRQENRLEAMNPAAMGSSCVIVLATDLPASARQLKRLAVRAGVGLSRTGSLYGHHSGDFVIAFSTAQRHPDYEVAVVPVRRHGENPPGVDQWFQAAAEATEEAILNAIFKAATMVGRDDHISYGLPLEETVAIMRQHGYPGIRLPAPSVTLFPAAMPA
jgi:D-aminopeptidase